MMNKPHNEPEGADATIGPWTKMATLMHRPQGPSGAAHTMRPSVFLKEGRVLQRVFLHEILWLQADRNYVEFHLLDRRLVIRSSLNELLRALPDDHFLRINRSQAVNVQLVDQVGPDWLSIKEKTFTLSRNYKDALFDLLNILEGR